MAPYAASYVPPRDDLAQVTTHGPVRVVLGVGQDVDMLEHKMDVLEHEPDSAEVLSAVRTLRQDGQGSMDIDDTPWWEDASLNGQQTTSAMIVLDTNILLRHLSLLRDVVTLLNSSDRPSVNVLVPHIVISELDKLKTVDRLAGSSDSRTRTAISTLARRAISWLLENLAGSTTAASALRGQRKDETLITPQSDISVENNDELVLDAALFHAQAKRRRVVLLTEDKNLVVKARVEGIDALGIQQSSSAQHLLELFETDRTNASTTQTNNVKVDKTQKNRRMSSDVERRTRDVEAFLATGESTSPRGNESSRGSRRSAAPVSPTSPSKRPAPTPWVLPSSDDKEAMMELEPDHAPLEEDDPNGVVNPTLIPVHKPSDVFVNASTVLVSFVAAKLYRHVFETLKQTKPKQQFEWQKQLGDWRWWSAQQCVQVMKDFWDEGKVRDVCLVGLERELVQVSKRSATTTATTTTTTTTKVDDNTTSTATSTANGTRKAPVDDKAIDQPRDRTQSRWASSTTTTPPGSTSTRTTSTTSYSSTASPSPTTSTEPTCKTSATSTRAPMSSNLKARLPAAKRLTNLSQALPRLCSSLATVPSDTDKWSGPRWEVLIETIGEILTALLGGFFDGGVQDAVDEVTQEWAAQLRRLGVDVVLDSIT
ncbi:hypothetical protein OIO90_000741 [Microbotryomycetes sp. JL221]|nr:hypothetical protein OIO90_000741 [Microbotryomycetes sp. JL221]